MKNTITVSVGISAFNEEKNINHVLNNIFRQVEKGWKLKEVYLFSDGSTDKTVESAKKIKYRRLKIIDDGKRMGKTERIQSFFKIATGEILVMFDADIQIKSKNIINYLIETFKNNNNVVLTGGNSIALPPKNFFQRGVYATFKVFYQSRIRIRRGKNLFACTGACIAIKKDFAKKIKFPEIKNQDTYLYFFCKSKKKEFDFVEKAIVYYKLPTNINDYLNQVFRSNPEAVQLKLKRYFGDLVYKEYDRGRLFYFKNVFKVFLDDPIPVIYISFINLMCKPFFKYVCKTDKMTWNSIESTK